MRKKREEGEGMKKIIYIKPGDPNLNAILFTFTDENFVVMLCAAIESQRNLQGNLNIGLN